jgi:hypothetical protein
MSVPLDRLYHYLADVVNHDLVIYRWTPHGSRKLEDLNQLCAYTWEQAMTRPVMICHDQEPLNFDYYTHDQIATAVIDFFTKNNMPSLANATLANHRASMHIRGAATPSSTNFYDQTLLLHSELHSEQVAKYTAANFVPVYYWSHALIAQDWFRYAEHDPELTFDADLVTHDFLIYNRAWSGTREYRLRFAEHIAETGLSTHCQIGFSQYDTDGHYSQHQFVNPKFRITNFNLQDFFPTNTHDATASADYNNQDYKHCGMEVVLETLFDDSRWHLTEKTLRPIACGKPFLLMGTAGSLKYLKQYGFKTFGDVIDESYDNVVNSHDRMQAVIAEMQRISQLSHDKKITVWRQLHNIAQHNKSVFFNQLQVQVIGEYVSNLNHGVTEIQKHCTGQHYQAGVNLFAPDSQEHTWIEQQTKFSHYRPGLEQWFEQHRSR